MHNRQPMSRRINRTQGDADSPDRNLPSYDASRDSPLSPASPAEGENSFTTDQPLGDPSPHEVSSASNGRPTSRGRDFKKFWLAATVSMFGSHVTYLALPLTAIYVLDATPAQMGWLSASGNLPFLVFGLLAGVWVDRLRRRPLLVASDLARAALLVSVPAAASVGLLSIGHLYAVSFALGSTGVVAAVAYQSFVATLVSRDRLVEGNSRLEVSNSVAGIGGPGLGGLMVDLLTAPIAILADAFSFVVSAILVASIQTPGPPADPAYSSHSTRRLVAEGLKIVLGNPVLKGIVSCGTVHNFFSRMIDALFVIYLVENLRLEAVWIGVITASGGIGALAGAVLAGPAARRLGLGPACIWAQILTGVSRLLIPLAGGPLPVTIAMLVGAEILLGVARPIFNINQVSLRLSLTPDRLHGRVNATMRFVMWSVTPIGAAVGGLLAGEYGTRNVLLGASVGVLLAFLLAAMSELRRVREIPKESWPG